MADGFHHDATDNHGSYSGPVGPFIEIIKKRHEAVAGSKHVLGNCIIDFDGPDAAIVETYLATFQRLTSDAGDYRKGFLRGLSISDHQDVETQVVARFVDKFTRRDSKWAIQERTGVYNAYRGFPAPAVGGLNSNWAVGTRHGNDLIDVLVRPLKSRRAKIGSRLHGGSVTH